MDSIRLEATYTDLGRERDPSAFSSGTVTCASRKIQAESADEFRGAHSRLAPIKLKVKKFMGAIEHDGFLRFNQISLGQTKQIVITSASAGAGGVVEARVGSPAGPLLGSVPVEVNGDWHAFSEKVIELKEPSGREDVYLVFKNEKNRGGLMNIDSVEFRK